MAKVEKRNGIYYIDPEWTMPSYEKIIENLNAWPMVKEYLNAWPQFYANLHLLDVAKQISEKDNTELKSFQQQSKRHLSKLYQAAADMPELGNRLNLLVVNRMKFVETFSANQNIPLMQWLHKLLVAFKDLQYFIITMMYDEQEKEWHDKLWSNADLSESICR